MGASEKDMWVIQMYLGCLRQDIWHRRVREHKENQLESQSHGAPKWTRGLMMGDRKGRLGHRYEDIEVGRCWRWNEVEKSAQSSLSKP